MISISFERAWEKGANNKLVDSFCLFESGSTMPHMGIALPLPALLFDNGFSGAAALNAIQHQINHHFLLHGIDLVLLVYDVRQRYGRLCHLTAIAVSFSIIVVVAVALLVLPCKPRPAHDFPLHPLLLPSLDSQHDIPHHQWNTLSAMPPSLSPPPLNCDRI